MDPYCCKEKHCILFCDSKNGLSIHSIPEHNQDTPKLSGYHSTTKHGREITSSLLGSSKGLRVDRALQYQAPNDNTGLALFGTSIEHGTGAIPVQRRCNVGMTGTLETNFSDSEHIGNESIALYNISVAPISFKNSFQLKNVISS